MKMLTQFSLKHPLASLSHTVIGALLSIPVIAPAVAQGIAPRLDLSNRLPSSQTASITHSPVRRDEGAVSHPAILNMLDGHFRNSIIYVGPDYLNKHRSEFSTSMIQKTVFQDKKIFLIDFNAINNYPNNKKIKKAISNALGVTFPADYIAIGQYKGELIYTQIKPNDVQRLKESVLQNMVQVSAKKTPDTEKAPSNEVPHVAFYLDINHKIDDAECSFPLAHITRPNFKTTYKPLCEAANISLKYRVNLMRSISGNSIGSAIPDKKIVRITLDDNSHGTGISLNKNLKSYSESIPPLRSTEAYKIPYDNWMVNYVTSAIARDYEFTVSAKSLMPDGSFKANDKATILKTVPASNVNPQIEVRETSGFEIGISTGLDVEKTGPKSKTEAKATFNQTRMLRYMTEDYRIERYSPDPSTVTFTWNRQNVTQADKLLSKTTGPMWNGSLINPSTNLDSPIQLSAISPIGYKSFTPNFDVVFIADSDATGKSKIKVDSSVNLWPIRAAAFNHLMWVSFQLQDHWQKTKRVTVSRDFEVNWDLPVFTGGRPVNLRLGGYNSKCISHGDNAKIELATCDIDSVPQSFIYDRFGRYLSAEDTGKCLDMDNLSELQTCNSNLSQRWNWVKGTDLLQNEWVDTYLAHDINENRLTYATEQSDRIKLRTMTDYTNIYNLKYRP